MDGLILSESGATLLAVIASLLWPGVISRPPKTVFHWQLGDVATWLLTVFALGALIAAWLAYREQGKAGETLAAQVKDQREANALQGKLLERALRSLTHQQAEQVSVVYDKWAGMKMPVVISPNGIYHRVKVTKDSGRPIRDLACRLYEQSRGLMPLVDRPDRLPAGDHCDLLGDFWRQAARDDGRQVAQRAQLTLGVPELRRPAVQVSVDDDPGQRFCPLAERGRKRGWPVGLQDVGWVAVLGQQDGGSPGSEGAEQTVGPDRRVTPRRDLRQERRGRGGRVRRATGRAPRPAARSALCRRGRCRRADLGRRR